MKKRPRLTSLGKLSVDTGDVVCFSSDSVLRILRALGKDVNNYEEFLQQFDGVPCQFAADGSYHVEKMTAVHQKGESCDLVVIGDGMRTFRRFLRPDEPTFTEFFEAHPLRERVGQGPMYRPRVFARIAKEYRQKLLRGSLR